MSNLSPGFSKDFHMLESASKHPAIQGIHDITTFTGILGKVPWLIYMIGSIPGLTSYNRFNIWCHDQLKEKRKASLLPSSFGVSATN